MDFFGAYFSTDTIKMVCGCYQKFVFLFNPPGTRLDSSSLGDSEVYANIQCVFSGSGASGTRTLTVNGSTYTQSGAYYNKRLITLFKANFSGAFKLYAFKIYDENNVLVRDYIPVRVGDVGYMYDKVSGQLFGNAGTGEFVLGSDIIDYTAKDYIQDGLIAMWDGIENVGFGEPHDSSATTWKNLAGGEDIEIYTQNAEWNDSALVGKERSFVNANTVLGLGSLAMPSTYETVEIVINSYDNSRIWVLFMHDGLPMSASHIALANHTRGLQFAYINGVGGGIDINELPTEGVRFGAARVGTSPSQAGGECYINGLLNTKPFNRSNYSPAARFGEGYRSNEYNAAPFVGEVCAMRFHSRALTAEEIVHNYEIDKARFGL
jgi:hypothetical protein